jgi:hypothetical protein
VLIVLVLCGAALLCVLVVRVSRRRRPDARRLGEVLARSQTRLQQFADELGLPVHPVYCNNCGRLDSTGRLFCMACGAVLDRSARRDRRTVLSRAASRRERLRKRRDAE